MKYEITDPTTSKKYELDWQGEKPPTNDEIHEAIGSTIKPNLTENAKGALGNVIQGATLGTGGLIGGLSNIAAQPAYSLAGADLPKSTVGEQFTAGKSAFEKPTSDFEKLHPFLATGSQLVGGLATGGTGLGIVGAGKTALARIGRGAVVGAGYGGAYGAGSSLAQPTEEILNSEKPNLLPTLENTAKGVGMGALIGGALPAVVGVGGFLAKGIKGLISPKTSAVDTLISTVQKEGETIDALKKATVKDSNIPTSEAVKQIVKPNLIKKSIETNTPIADLAGFDVRQLAQLAKSKNAIANNILSTHAESELSKQPSKLTEIINKTLGNKSKIQNLDMIQAKYEAEAKPMYDKAFASGDLAQIDPTIAQTASDEFLQKYIKQARSSAMGRGLKDLPDTDISVLDAAKRKMDDAISVAQRTGEKEDARAIMGLKNELVNQIDSVVPEYKQARSIASERFKLEEAQNTASKIVKGENAEAIGEIMPTLSPAEKDAFTIGLRDEMMRQIAENAKTGRTNIAEKMFGNNDNYKVRQNLRAALGDTDYTKLMTDIDPLVQSGFNASQLIGGSQTAEKTALHARGLHGLLIKIGRKVVGEQTNQKYADIAKMLTDPKYLEKRMAEQKKPIVEKGAKTVINLLRRGINGTYTNNH